MFFWKGDLETDGFHVFFPVDAGFVAGKGTPQDIYVFIINTNAYGGDFHTQPKGEIGKRRPYGVLICAREASRAEFDAAKIAGDYAGKFAYAAVQQNRQHGAAGCAVRLAAVIVCDPGGIAGRACAKSPTVMRGIGMFLPLALDEGSGVVNACAVGDCSEKAATAHQKLRTVRLARS